MGKLLDTVVLVKDTVFCTVVMVLFSIMTPFLYFSKQTRMVLFDVLIEFGISCMKKQTCTSDSKEVLPCPFCGNDEIMFYKSKGDDDYKVTCYECHCTFDAPIMETMDDALKVWNRRVEQKNNNGAQE